MKARSRDYGQEGGGSLFFDPVKAWLIRKARGETLRDVATAIGRTEGVVSQYEKGTTLPPPALITALAEHFGVRHEFFYHDGSVDRSAPAFFRARGLSARFLESGRARAQVIGRLIAEVDTGEPPVDVPSNPPRENAPLSEVEALAEEVRKNWGIGAGPIRSAIGLLEEHGIVVLRRVMTEESLDAFSTWLPLRPLVVLGTTATEVHRDRFSAIHELGHLVMHRATDFRQAVRETQANWFAAAFLMPRYSFTKLLPRSSGWSAQEKLLQLRTEWGVSTSALLIRARHLGFLTRGQEDALRRWARQVASVREMTPTEMARRRETPHLLRRWISEYHSSGGDVDDLSSRTGIVPSEVASLLESSAGDLESVLK